VIDGLAEDPVAAFAAIQGAYDYLETELVPALRARPGDDLISYLAAAEVDDGPLADGTIAAMAFNVVGAGFDTTFKTLSSSLALLAEDQDVQRRLRDAADTATAADELIRLFAPVSAGRKVVGERRVDEVTLNEGDAVLLAFPAACRDPEVFPNPDVADFARAPNKHVAFGSGIHLCLGMHLARLELAIALEEILSAFASFELAPGATPQYSQSQVWGATSVPVSFRRR
jgi:cytochrome P450